MGSKEKLIERFKSLPKDFSWEEVKRLLKILGYTLRNKGKTSGSRVIFICQDRKPIMLHKPHPENTIKEYALKQLLNDLKEEGLI
ncbi:MAG: type II toxin-antitoxin system HicA family toxin [Muribaculaceae bacterium]|nr:type II toxin-antitoxin system HicA family toxin [Muribaculaceae bacterium]MDE6682569.1 type II toxin-antitoxin system HicA family toxin [Muribaculaceae bacterium]